MAGKTLERTVEEAEHAAGPAIQEQGRRVASLVPVRTPTEAQRLESTTQAAVDATRSLAVNTDAVRRFLLARRPERAEQAFIDAGRGVERPEQVFTNAEEAREHSNAVLDLARGSSSAQTPGSATASGLALRALSDEHLAQAQETIEGYSRTVSDTWFTGDFLGETVYRRYSGTPPIVTGEDDSWLRAMALATGGYHPGTYYPGTNHIIVGAYEANREEGDVLKLLAHEQLHYAAYLGGGQTVRWRDDSGAAILQPRVGGWNIHEGTTELLANELARANGYSPSGVAYTYETSVCFALEQVVGQEPLRRAYFSGDFTEVRRLMDERLGAGTFDALMACSSAPDAFSLIMGKVGAAGVDYHSWESNPIMAQCYSQIAVERFR
jgi:hypothetical protein